MSFIHKIFKPWFIHKPYLIIRALLSDIGFLSKGWVRTSTCFGALVWCDNTKSIGRSIYRNSVYELPTSEIIWRLLTSNTTFVDVGANIGYYSLLAVKKLSRSGKVIAFEPRPDIFNWLEKNLSGSDNVEIHSVAVSNESGKATLNIPKGSEENEGIATLSKSVDSIVSYQVKTARLDEFINTTIDVLKIDVEGHEYYVLLGAAQLLEKKLIQNIVFEEHDENNSLVIPLLLKYEYSIYSIGWDVNGVILQPLGQPNFSLINDAKNFVATITPGQLMEHMSLKGWSILNM